MNDGSILICYDGSDGARRAIYAAAALLGPRRAVVLDIGPVLTGAESYAVMSSALAGGEFEQLNAAEALDRAAEGALLARVAGFEATARSGVAAPTWEGIVDVADEMDAAVIVMGTRGSTGAREFFEGSVSHQVAEHSARPVLIVPPRSRR
jgi:nucleotide-binding universal stress UspA family protein